VVFALSALSAKIDSLERKTDDIIETIKSLELNVNFNLTSGDGDDTSSDFEMEADSAEQ
jgi:hypothetical protein